MLAVLALRGSLSAYRCKVMSPNSIGKRGEEPVKAIKIPSIQDDLYSTWSFARVQAPKWP